MKESSSLVYYLLIILVSFFAFFANNHIVPAGGEESRTIAAAQEMVRTGNYFAIHESSPLPVWIAAGIENIVPDNLPAQRCAAGLAATLMVVFIYLLIVRLSGSRNISLTAALILATCFNPVVLGRTVSWEVYCHSFMLGAVCFMVRGISARGSGRGWMFLSGLFMGCSFLCKGLLSFFVVLLPFLIAYAMVIRPKTAGKGAGVVVLFITALLSSLWWYVCLYIADPEIFSTLVSFESMGWLPGNGRPLWYYWKFPVQAGIWGLLWITSIIYFFSKRRTGRHRRLFAFSMVWFITAMVVITIIPGKDMRYLVPAVIPGALTITMYTWNLARNPTSRGDRVIFRLNAAVITVALLCVPVIIYLGFYEYELLKLPLFIVIAVCFAILTLVIIRSLLRKGSRLGIKSVFASVVIAMMVLEAFCLPAIGNVFVKDDRQSIRHLMDNPVEDDPVLFDTTEQGAGEGHAHEDNN